MNTKNVLLGVFVILTIIFASSTFIEYGQVAKSTTTLTSTTVTTATLTTTQPVGNGYWIYVTASGCGSGGPCWDGDPYIFNCASAAATPQGCTRQVTSTLAPHPGYIINIKYPFANQTGPTWANCLWTVQGIYSGQGYAICIPLNSTSFIMGEQGPPPP